MNKHNIIIAIIVVFVIAACVIGYIFISQSSDEDDYWEQDHGWINCMPPLSDSEAKTCSDAEKHGYPKIAY